MLKPLDKMTVKVNNTMERDMDNMVTKVFFRFLPIFAKAIAEMEMPFLETFFIPFFLDK